MKARTTAKGLSRITQTRSLSALQKNGGEIMLHTKAEKIIVRQGAVKGVKLENGEEIKAKTVISNVDATQTFEEMVGEERLPSSFVRKLHTDEALTLCFRGVSFNRSST